MNTIYSTCKFACMFALRAILGVVSYLIGSECALPELTCHDVLKLCLPRFPFTGVEGVAFYSPQPPNCRKDVRKWMYDFSRMYADVRIFGGLRGVGPAIFLAFACRGGAASTEIASWGAAGCPAIGAGRPDKWAEGTKGGSGGHATRCGSRAHVVLCINSKLAIGWLLFFV